MYISGNNLTPINQITSVQNKSNSLNNPAVDRREDELSISIEGRNALNKVRELGNKYNVNDISQKERLELTEELMQGGLINSGTGLHLIAPTSMNEKPSDRSDFLNSMKESLLVDKNPLNSEHMQNKLKAIKVLEDLKQSRES